MPARCKQIGQRADHEQAMSILSEPAIAHFGEAKHSLDDADRMFDFGPYFRFAPVFRPLHLVHDTAMSIAAVDEIAGSRGVPADHRLLAAYA